jgi:hypothetical protein
MDFEGNAYHVWRTARTRSQSQTYDQVREAVARDLRAYRAYERAGERARELLDELAKLPPETESPLAELAKKHPGLTTQPAKPFFTGIADFAPRRAGPTADEEMRESVRQGLFARLVRSEDLQPGQAAVVGDPIARVQYLLRVVKRTDPNLDDFRLARYTFRLLALEQKRDRFLEAWLEAAKKRADIQLIKEEEKEQRPQPAPDEDL